MPRTRKSGYLLSILNPETGRYDKYPITRKLPDKSMWEAFKMFINSLPVNEEFTRKQMFEGVYDETSAKAMRRFETTVDHYRLYSCHVGYLDHIGHAKYRKLHNLPQKMTTTMLQRFARNEAPWQSWFIPKHMRIQTIKELCQ